MGDNGAAVILYDGLGDIQPQPGTACALCPGFIQPVKPVKQLFQLIRRNILAGIGNRQPDLLLTILTEGNLNVGMLPINISKERV